jgi:hypothetical protein
MPAVRRHARYGSRIGRHLAGQCAVIARDIAHPAGAVCKRDRFHQMAVRGFGPEHAVYEHQVAPLAIGMQTYACVAADAVERYPNSAPSLRRTAASVRVDVQCSTLPPPLSERSHRHLAARRRTDAPPVRHCGVTW